MTSNAERLTRARVRYDSNGPDDMVITGFQVTSTIWADGRAMLRVYGEDGRLLRSVQIPKVYRVDMDRGETSNDEGGR